MALNVTVEGSECLKHRTTALRNPSRCAKAGQADKCNQTFGGGLRIVIFCLLHGRCGDACMTSPTMLGCNIYQITCCKSTCECDDFADACKDVYRL